MTDKETAPKAEPKPKGVKVYCLASSMKTSEGRVHHGDTVTVPKAEADALKAKGLAK